MFPAQLQSVLQHRETHCGKPGLQQWGLDRQRGPQGVFMSSSLSKNSPLWYHSQILLLPLHKGQAVQHDLEVNKKREINWAEYNIRIYLFSGRKIKRFPSLFGEQHPLKFLVLLRLLFLSSRFQLLLWRAEGRIPGTDAGSPTLPAEELHFQ